MTLLGPSGCGKTTTLRMLAGLEHPSAGRILIGGRDVTMVPAHERDVSMVFQSYALFPHMNALDNVAYGLESSGYKKREARERAEEGLAQVGLGGMGHRLPAELSGGQQQRVAVARALVLNPQVLLLDEPCPTLMPGCAGASGRKSASCSSGSVSPPSTSPTTRTKHLQCPTGSWS